METGINPCVGAQWLWTAVRQGSVVALGVDQGGQEDVSEPLDVDRVEIVVGEVKFEASAEALDPALELPSAQYGDGCGNLFKSSARNHLS